MSKLYTLVSQAIVKIVDSAKALFIHVSKRSLILLPQNQGNLDLNALPRYVGFTLEVFYIFVLPMGKK